MTDIQALIHKLRNAPQRVGTFGRGDPDPLDEYRPGMTGEERDWLIRLVEQVQETGASRSYREIIARILVPHWLGGFEHQERADLTEADGYRPWKHPPFTPNARAYQIADEILLALSLAQQEAKTCTHPRWVGVASTAYTAWSCPDCGQSYDSRKG
jgi:hypothetical protein